MGSDIWVRSLGPIAPQGVTWMCFPNGAHALRYSRSEDGGSLRIQHTQVTRAAKANATRDGYAFTFDESSSFVVASSARSQAHPRHPRPICQPLGSRPSDVLAAVQTFAAPSTHAAGATGLLMRHACNLWKDWYSVFHVLVLHVGTSWHPTLLNVMHVISVCIPPRCLYVVCRVGAHVG